MWAESQLNEQKRILSMHAADIERTKEELMLEKVALEKDMDVIAAYARKLSYIREGEKIVKITGLATYENHIYDPGSVLMHRDVRYFPEWFCKSIGLVFFILSYCILLIFDAGRGFIKEQANSSREKTFYEEAVGMPSL